MTRRTLLALLLALAALSLLAAGCGGDDDAGAPATETQSVPFDRAFIDAMVPHHEEAIEMARAAKEAGLSEPVLVEIADAIIATQQEEIDRMKAWREEWFGSAEIDPDGARALGMPMEEMGMNEAPVDFSGEQDVDGAFAAMMVAHHKGAIAMAELARQRTEREEIASLAADIVAAQQEEIETLQEFVPAGGHDMGDMDGMDG